ncbi:MAG: DUF547 domain-containing protein [Acidobacteria bacterium]|nr:DUF547 domain-containing protein [Acidobacteriota bacterium]
MKSPQNRRISVWVKRVSLFLVVAAIVLVIRAAPIDLLLGALKSWIAGLGPWGPVIFALIYAVWAVAFLPGAALTLAGGAIFGLGWGFAAVICGATLGAALSFLIARYVAREKVSKMAHSNPKFGAIDRAIGEGGWKIVAMLRLSPAIPFNLQNYLYGLTPIRFWPCVLTSAVFMMPGTLLYVYLGYVGGQGLAAASGGGVSTQRWALIGIGLAATVGVTVYVTKLAQKALAKQTALSEPPPDAKPVDPAPGAARRPPWLMATLAALFFSAALYANLVPGMLAQLFGPPKTQLSEVYEAKPDGPSFDHSSFDALLPRFVDGEGLVDYKGLSQEETSLDDYIASITTAPFPDLGRDEKLALLINAYNAFTLKLILDNYPVDSIQDIPSKQRWDAKRWIIGGQTYSLSQIEHEQIRPKFIEPRIHFALVCAAVGCPKLRQEAYVGSRINEQLEEQAKLLHGSQRWFRFEPGDSRVRLTQLYNWYGGDFAQVAGSPLENAARYSPALQQTLSTGKKPRIDWIDYDWALNQQ